MLSGFHSLALLCNVSAQILLLINRKYCFLFFLKKDALAAELTAESVFFFFFFYLIGLNHLGPDRGTMKSNL